MPVNNIYMAGAPYGPTATPTPSRTPTPTPTRTSGPPAPQPTPVGPPPNNNTGGSGGGGGSAPGNGGSNSPVSDGGWLGGGDAGGGLKRCPQYATKVKVELSFVNGGNYTIYKDPLSGALSIGGQGATLNIGGINWKWSVFSHKGIFYITNDLKPGSWTPWSPMSGDGKRNIGRSNIYLRSEKDHNRKIYINETPTTNVPIYGTVYQDRFNAVSTSNFKFENDSYRLVFKEAPKILYTTVGCLEDRTSSNLFNIVTGKLETKVLSQYTNGSTIKLYRNTSGKFVLLGGATSLSAAGSGLQYKNSSSVWTNLPNAAYPVTIKTNTGRTLSLNNGSLILDDLDINGTDTQITVSYAGSDTLLPCTFVIKFEYILKVLTKCQFEDSSTIFMGKRTSGSTPSKIDDLMDISRNGRLKWYATPTPTPSLTAAPSRTPSPTATNQPTLAPTPTSTSTPTPTPTLAFSINYNDRIGGDLMPFISYDESAKSYSVYEYSNKNYVATNQTGNKVVIGCSRRHHGAAQYAENPQGVVKAFSYNSTSKKWETMGSDIRGVEPGDYFGSSVSMDDTGNIVVVGSIGSAGERRDKQGAGRVDVYKYTSTGWTQLGQTIYGKNMGDGCGFEVAINGDGSRIAIGSYSEDRNIQYEDNAGKVRVYSYNSTSKSWVQLGGTIEGEYWSGLVSGSFLSFNSTGDVLAVGQARLLKTNANGALTGQSTAGANVFALQGGDWVRRGSSIMPLPNNSNTSYTNAMRVSLNSAGTRIAIGDYIGAEYNSGFVRVYDYSNGSWALIGTLNTNSDYNGFGYGLQLDGTGNRIVIGSVLESSGEIPYVGGAYVYKYNGGTAWELVGSKILGSLGSSFAGAQVCFSKDSSSVFVAGVYGGVAAYGLKTIQPSPTPTRTSGPTPTPTRTSTPTPTPTRTSTPTPTATLVTVNNAGSDYYVGNFKTVLEYFDATAGQNGSWKVLPNEFAYIKCDLYPQRRLGPGPDMPLTMTQVDPDNRLISNTVLRNYCYYDGTSLYANCSSTVKKIVYIPNNFITASLANAPVNAQGSQLVRTYSLPAINYSSGVTGIWSIPTGSPLSIKSVTLYSGNVIPNAYDFTVRPYYPYYNKVAFVNPGIIKTANLTVYQPSSGVNYLSGSYLGSGAAKTGVFYSNAVPSGRVSGPGSQSGRFFKSINSSTSAVSGPQNGIFYTGVNRTLFSGAQTGVFFTNNTSGQNLTFGQSFELDYIVESKRLKMQVTLNLTGVKN